MDIVKVLEDLTKSLILGFFIGVLIKANIQTQRRSVREAKKNLRMFLYESFKLKKEIIIKYKSGLKCSLTDGNIYLIK